MKVYELTFNRTDIEEIYDLAKIKKELKSFNHVLPIIGSAASLVTGIYWLFKEGNSENILVSFLAIGFGIHLGTGFLKNHKSIKARLKEIENYISKNEKYSYHKVILDGDFLIIDQDTEYGKFSLKTLNQLKIYEEFASLSFEKENILLPKRSFQTGKWQEFIQEIKGHENESSELN